MTTTYKVKVTPDEKLAKVGDVLSFRQACELLEMNAEQFAERAYLAAEMGGDGFVLECQHGQPDVV